MFSWTKNRPAADADTSNVAEVVRSEGEGEGKRRSLGLEAFLVAIEIAWIAALIVGAVFLIRAVT